MRSISKTFWKWSLPFLILYFSLSIPELRQVVFRETNQRNDLNAGFFSGSIFKAMGSENDKQLGKINTDDIDEKAFMKDPFKPFKFNSGLNRKIPINPLQGIELQKDGLLALIDGRKLKIGESIYGMRVINISNNKVVLAGHGKARVFYLF